ncbi:gliding motility-associated C-terminal domain-containing protein [Flavobacterium swingsii]|jgi:gliding motility-associated-like protein|uniref:Gliding motility-associated C-terminal domain-containing protein n=1 Tax=Flavobacterium swingsii TaxID=498292 RepID=A0A1I0ZSF5_9FLAO|nr:gliding motility-associated C-terminal domain-containing protein [Flavobacterium swingsii]SFB27093.1 gliding motility-associated C-terminal domain-containing protein [Flavobacterium swingsii]
MNKHYFLLVLILFLSQKSVGQSNCLNSDFSSGDFTGWDGNSGSYGYPSEYSGIITGRQTIISTQAFDENTCGLLPKIPPGELFSARLGNMQTGSEAEELNYTISVDSNNTVFIYKYAVVLQDPGHEEYEQPRFTIRILNSNGDVINPDCGVYDVYAGQPGQDFQYCNDVVWLPWKTIGIDLSPYIGQNLKIEFTTRDCSRGGHYGYAYISAKCSNLKVNVKICSGDSNFTLSAPEGFAQYLWTHNNQPIGSTQSLTLPIGSYVPGDTFNCALTSFSNGVACTSNIIGVLTESVIINPLFNVATTCGNSQLTSNPISFVNQTTFQNGTIQQWLWDFGDGTTSTERDPQHVYLNSGTFTVTLKAISETGCYKTYSTNIVVNNNPIPLPNITDPQTFCMPPAPTISDFNSNGNTFFWYDSPTATVMLPLSTPLIHNTIYYCALLQGNCYGPRKAIKAILKNVKVPTGESIQKFCLINHPTIASLTVTGNYIEWHSQAQGGSILSSTTPLSNSTYYAFEYDPISGCRSKTGFAVNVHVGDYSSLIPDTLFKEFCEEDNPTVQNLFFEGLITIVYDNINSNTPLAENETLNDGNTYYASVYNAADACESDKRCEISVSIVPCEIYPYNTITINDNNQNDYFAIKNIEYFPDNDIEIYNRFGQIVYKKDNYGFNNNWFNGKANAGDIIEKNKKLPTGTYYYIINFKKESLQLNKTKKGFIYILNNE